MNKEDNVIVIYDDYGNSNPKISEIQFNLPKDKRLTLKYQSDDCIALSMADTISDNTELEGNMNYHLINTLIKGLSQLKNQMVKNDCQPICRTNIGNRK